MKSETLLLLGGGGLLLYLMSRNSGTGSSAPLLGSYGSSFAKPVNGAKAAAGGAAANAAQQQQQSNPLSSLLSALGSIAKGIGGGGVSGGTSNGGNSSPTFSGDSSSGQTIWGDNVSGNVFETGTGSSLSFGNFDATDLFGDPYGNGQPVYDNAPVDVPAFDTAGNDSSSSNDNYTGGGDFGDLGTNW